MLMACTSCQKDSIATLGINSNLSMLIYNIIISGV